MEYEPRTVGREIEYGVRAGRNGVMYMADEVRSHLCDIAGSVLRRFRPPEISENKEFLGNGGRMYIDVGAHPEYSGAETTSLLELAAGGVAGDIIMFQTFRNASTDDFYPGQPKYLERFNLFKNVRAGGNSWGCHENYEVSRAIAGFDEGRISPAGLGCAVGFMAIRPLVAGIGYIDTSEGQFLLAQKASVVNADTHSDTQIAKPLINLRNRSFGDDQKIARLHVTSCDPTSPHVTVRSMGVTSLMLRLMEFDALDAKGAYWQPLSPQWRAIQGWHSVARGVAADLSLRQAYSIVLDGQAKSMTALDMHELAADKMSYLTEQGLASSEERWAYDDYVSVIGVLRSIVETSKTYRSIQERTLYRTEAYAGLRTRLDWADRLHVVMTDQQKKPEQYAQAPNPLQSERARKVNEVYDMLGSQDGPGLPLKRAARPEAVQWAPLGLVEQRMTTAPEGRARLRGDFVRLLEGYPTASTTWCSLRFSMPATEAGQSADSYYMPLKDSKAGADVAYDEFMRVAGIAAHQLRRSA